MNRKEGFLNTRKVGRMTGIIASVGSIALWMKVVLGFHGEASIQTNVCLVHLVTIALLMIILALTGIYAAFKDRVSSMVMAFAGSFFPIGLYTFSQPGIIKGIGVFNCLYCAAAVLMYYGRKPENSNH
jgi:hypothetical protein